MRAERHVHVVPVLRHALVELEGPLRRRGCGLVGGGEREDEPDDPADDGAFVRELVVAVVELLDVPLRNKKRTGTRRGGDVSNQQLEDVQDVRGTLLTTDSVPSASL